MLYPRRMPMELWIKPAAADLVGPYMMQLTEHNKKVIAHREGEEYADSGFDLYIPRNPDHNEGKWVFPPHTTVKIPLGIKIVNRALFARRVQDVRRTSGVWRTEPFYIYARSSISKTPLGLANNQGIIDAGYRGELMVALDNVAPKQWVLNPGTRLVQVCMHDLSPFMVSKVEKDFEATERGEGGFGSTGR